MTVREALRAEKGRAAQKEGGKKDGWEFDGSFDNSEGSQQLEVLDQYLSVRAGFYLSSSIEVGNNFDK